LAIAKADDIIKITKTIDLIDNLAVPQIPCPEVQPLPKDAPSPINNPPKINPIMFV